MPLREKVRDNQVVSTELEQHADNETGYQLVPGHDEQVCNGAERLKELLAQGINTDYSTLLVLGGSLPDVFGEGQADKKKEGVTEQHLFLAIGQVGCVWDVHVDDLLEFLSYIEEA